MRRRRLAQVLAVGAHSDWSVGRVLNADAARAGSGGRRWQTEARRHRHVQRRHRADAVHERVRGERAGERRVIHRRKR